MRRMPVEWDGLEIAWEGWRYVPSSIDFHVRECCGACGAERKPVLNFGWSYPEGPRILSLIAFRCQSCRLDVVKNVNDGTWWELEAEDYATAANAPSD